MSAMLLTTNINVYFYFLLSNTNAMHTNFTNHILFLHFFVCFIYFLILTTNINVTNCFFYLFLTCPLILTITLLTISFYFFLYSLYSNYCIYFFYKRFNKIILIFA